MHAQDTIQHAFAMDYFSVDSGINAFNWIYTGNSVQNLVTPVDHLDNICLALLDWNQYGAGVTQEDKDVYEIQFEKHYSSFLATSIDAFAVGITFFLLQANIFMSIAIGLVFLFYLLVL